MYRKLEDFYRDWAYESESTLKLINFNTDESLKKEIIPGGRSVGFLADHLSKTIVEMMALTGLKIEGRNYDDPVPATVKEIADDYHTTSEKFISALKQNWTDEMLNNEDEMYGEIWKKGQTLLYLLLHQTHHRGQMTVLMRQAGVPVNGVYGPAKEEWEAMGLPAHK